jgi:DNA end-binding protein Ku
MASTVWKGNIAFGLVSIPVRLVRAARRERVRFRQVYREREPEPEPEIEATEPEIEPVQPVRQVNIAPVQVPRSEILKGYEVTPEQFVTFTQREVAAVKPKTSTAIDIVSFAHLAEIDPIYFDASYYVLPQPAGEKAYSVLFAALRNARYVGLGELAMHGREHVVVIRTGEKGLILDTLFYAKEVHLEDQYATDTKLPTSPELKIAEAFIQALAAPFAPEQLVDKYEERLKALIDQRSSQEALPAEPTSKPAIDIMEALRKSLEMVRKPAASQPAKDARPRKRRAAS